MLTKGIEKKKTEKLNYINSSTYFTFLDVCYLILVTIQIMNKLSKGYTKFKLQLSLRFFSHGHGFQRQANLHHPLPKKVKSSL